MSTKSSRSRSVAATWALCGVVGLGALFVFAHDLAAEPPFVDESAFLSQTYYWDLFVAGKRDAPEWVTYPAIDLPPLPKYLFGLALWSTGHARPGPEAAAAWYADTSRRFVSPAGLLSARASAVVCGVVGVMALFGLGSMIAGRGVGMVAAGLLVVNPLYRLHARRAMADAPAEALILLTVLIGFWVGTRLLRGRLGPWTWVGAVLQGVLGGLAVEAKLNGGLGFLIVWAWSFLGLFLGKIPTIRRLAWMGATTMASLLGFATFVALNPTLTAQPSGPLPPPVAALAQTSMLGRTSALIEHRASVSVAARDQFPHNALRTPIEKGLAVLVQGFGRFGPLGPSHSDSTRRYDRSQDWGAWIWLPVVVTGATIAGFRGRREYRRDEPPSGWFVLVMAAVALVTVTSFVPLAWDRYFLSIQPSCALLGGIGLVSVVTGIGRGLGPRPREAS